MNPILKSALIYVVPDFICIQILNCIFLQAELVALNPAILTNFDLRLQTVSQLEDEAHDLAHQNLGPRLLFDVHLKVERGVIKHDRLTLRRRFNAHRIQKPDLIIILDSHLINLFNLVRQHRQLLYNLFYNKLQVAFHFFTLMFDLPLKVLLQLCNIHNQVILLFRSLSLF